jgi:hypothetical protein
MTHGFTGKIPTKNLTEELLKKPTDFPFSLIISNKSKPTKIMNKELMKNLLTNSLI